MEITADTRDPIPKARPADLVVDCEVSLHDAMLINYLVI